jgi:hypothetical protein
MIQPIIEKCILIAGVLEENMLVNLVDIGVMPEYVYFL